MPVTALAPWFGSNRLLAQRVAKSLGRHAWVGIVFAGGMSEIPWIRARTVVVNDLHRHIINLAEVAADPKRGPLLYRKLRRKLFHVDVLQRAQRFCRKVENDVSKPDPVEWAEHYFVAAWMTRHAKAGTKKEFDGTLSFRWSSNGGDSATHYRSAVKALVAWRKIARTANFVCMDGLDFVKGCLDKEVTGIYCDPPFPGPGESYKHTFGEDKHRELAQALSTFRKARVVCRFYDHPLIREIYPRSHWKWTFLNGRKASNATAPEVLLVNKSCNGQRRRRDR